MRLRQSHSVRDLAIQCTQPAAHLTSQQTLIKLEQAPGLGAASGQLRFTLDHHSLPMKSQYWHCLLAILSLPPLTVASVPPIKNVFQIDYRKASQYKSSCVPHVNKFGTMWLQMHEMTANAIDALSAKRYTDPKEARTRTLLYSFFGIAPKEKPDANGYEYSINEITKMQQQGRGEPGNTYNRKLSAVRSEYLPLLLFEVESSCLTRLFQSTIPGSSTFPHI